jgi:hypothetical protein
MQKINIHEFLVLGQHLAVLKQIEPNEALGNDWLRLYRASWALEEIRTKNVGGLKTCIGAVAALINAIHRIVPSDIGEINFDEIRTKKVGEWLTGDVHTRVYALETLLEEELKIANTYSIDQKAAYLTSDLLDHPLRILPESVAAKLSEQSRKDLAAAVRCFVLDSPTASGFHLMRCIESALLAYLKKVTGNSPPRARNWGVYLQQLERSGQADQKLTGLLKHVKDAYRNPVSHPDVFLDEDEVMTLMGVAVSVLTQLTRQT